MTTPTPQTENVLPQEFVSHLRDAFCETFRPWAQANEIPDVIISGVEDALYIAESADDIHPQHLGEFITSITQAIVLMGGKFHTGSMITIPRPMLMLATDEAKAQAGHDSDLLEKFVKESASG